MKLLSKYNRINIMATIIVLLLSATCYYFFLKSTFIHELDEDLQVEEKEITDYVKQNNRLPEPINYKDQQQEFLPANEITTKRQFSNVNIFNKKDNENGLYRQLEFPLSFARKNYKMLIRESQDDTEDLRHLILMITLLMVVILLITLFVINRFLLNKLWKPFNTTLQEVKQFNLSGKNVMQLPQSDITEFTELNQAVTIMTNRVTQDYNEIKSFTENASHEIQTPLAIIKSKLELLSQSESLKEEQMNTIQSVYEATNRLSKLNQSLILLTKIDNQQFHENESVNLSDLINKHLTNYEELIAAKLITVAKNIEADIKLTMNEALAEILISNLITNSIKHNIDNGFIKLSLNQAKLIISNSGVTLTTTPSELFERFKKDKITSESLGLGLSIVKKICELYNYKIEYHYLNLVHTTSINFCL